MDKHTKLELYVFVGLFLFVLGIMCCMALDVIGHNLILTPTVSVHHVDK